MTVMLVFAVTLLLAVLVSDLAERRVPLTSMVFLAAGAKIERSHADRLLHLAALCIGGSIIARSSTEVLVARWFRKVERPAEAGAGG